MPFWFLNNWSKTMIFLALLSQKLSFLTHIMRMDAFWKSSSSGNRECINKIDVYLITYFSGWETLMRGLTRQRLIIRKTLHRNIMKYCNIQRLIRPYPLRRTFRSKGLVHFGYVRRTTILDIFMQWFRDVRPDLVLGLPGLRHGIFIYFYWHS